MERRIQSKRTMGLAAVAVGAVLLAACGDDEDFANDARPPKTIVVTASITADKVSVSPRRFGAGTVSLVVTNQTESSQQVVLSSSGSAAGRAIEQRTGPINPSDTSSLKADLRQGSYTLASANAPQITPAEIAVGSSRPSAQDQLLQP